MFCVECGREVGDALTSNGLCHTCFLAKTRLTRLPEHVDFEVCVHCRARKKGEQWLDPPEGGHRVELIVEEAVRAALDVDRRASGVRVTAEVLAEDERNYAVTVHASGVAEGVPFEEQASTRSRIKNATCLRCSRMQGNYYESVVQVRGENRELLPEEMRDVRVVASRVIDRIVDSGDRNAFVLKDEEVHGGLDVYIATNNAGRQMAKAIGSEFGGRVSEHPKIAGQKDGIELWRVTFLVRLPGYRSGDFVVVKDEPFLVQSVTPKNVAVRDLRRGHVRTLERSELERATVLARRDAREAVVVAESDSEMQLLDPWTFATVTVLKPAGLARAGEVVPVARWEDELLPFPPL